MHWTTLSVFLDRINNHVACSLLLCGISSGYNRKIGNERTSLLHWAFSLLRKITRKCYSYRVNHTWDCYGARLRSISYLKTDRNVTQTVEQLSVREREQMLLWADQKLLENTSLTQTQTAFSVRPISLLKRNGVGLLEFIQNLPEFLCPYLCPMPSLLLYLVWCYAWH